MKIQTQYENTRCRICGTHIPYGADCIWVSGTPGVTCVNPCQPRVSAPKKPRKVSGRVTPASQPENVSGGTATQARGIPEAEVLTRIPCPEAGLQAFRETCDTFDLPSLLSLQRLINAAVEQCRVDVHNAAGEQPAVGPRFPRALPVPTQPDPYHCECPNCGHIWDTKEGKPAGCPWCGERVLTLDKLGTIFNPIDRHSCRPWAFHDPDNAAHTKNCTSCQLQPRACTTRNDVKPVTKPRNPKFSF